MDDFELREYFNNVWLKDKNNQYRSFTYWSFLYDMLIEGRVSDQSRIHNELWSIVMSAERYNENLHDRLTDRAIAELMDISELQEVIENYETYQKGERELVSDEEYLKDCDKNFSFIQ